MTKAEELLKECQMLLMDIHAGTVITDEESKAQYELQNKIDEYLSGPTFEEVVSAWEEDEDLEVITPYDVIMVRRKGTTIIEYDFRSWGTNVRTGVVYSKHQNAYNLTIRYLESQKRD